MVRSTIHVRGKYVFMIFREYSIIFHKCVCVFKWQAYFTFIWYSYAQAPFILALNIFFFNFYLFIYFIEKEFGGFFFFFLGSVTGWVRWNRGREMVVVVVVVETSLDWDGPEHEWGLDVVTTVWKTRRDEDNSDMVYGGGSGEKLLVM